MEQRDTNFTLKAVSGATKTLIQLDRNPKWLKHCGRRKENLASSEMDKSHSKSLHNLGLLRPTSDVNIKKISSDFEGTRNVFKSGNEKRKKIKNELLKYRNELQEFAEATKELEERYTVINSELNDMKQKYNYFTRNMPQADFDTFSDCSSSSNGYSPQRKSTQIFYRGNSFMRILNSGPLKEINYKLPHKSQHKNISIVNNCRGQTKSRRRVSHQRENKENMTSAHASHSSFDKSSETDYLGSKAVLGNRARSHCSGEVAYLNRTITKLQNDSERFCSIIEQQQNTLSDYRLRFVKAKSMVKEQRMAIEQLNAKNQQIEKDASSIIEDLHHKIDAKLRDVDALSGRMSGDYVKRNHLIKENHMLHERMQVVEAEAKELKLKLEEMSRRKVATISRLKAAERDLKIFKNYNAALKQEKCKLNEQMKALNAQIENMQDATKRTLMRHREQHDKQKRQMQKRIFELEMKLNRSQNSKTSLLQERDTLIAELQSQLNNLVHNFEISQKHIRVLRRQIYSMSENENRQPYIRNRSLG